MSDAQIFAIITNGSGGMPSYASQVSFDDRWKAILHVRKLQGPKCNTRFRAFVPWNCRQPRAPR